MSQSAPGFLKNGPEGQGHVSVEREPDGTGDGKRTFMVTIGSEKIKIVGDDQLREFRTGVEAGKGLDEVLSLLARNPEYQNIDLPDENFLTTLGNQGDIQSNIDALMKGETRPEVYIVMRTSKSKEGGDSAAPGFTRVLLRRENGRYVLKRNETIKHQHSDKLLPQDKLILTKRESGS